MKERDESPGPARPLSILRPISSWRMTVNTPVKISGAPRHALQVRTYVEQLALRIRCEFLSQGFWFNFPRTAEMNHTLCGD